MLRHKCFIPADENFEKLAEHILHTTPTGRMLRKALRPFFIYEHPMPVDLEMYVREELGKITNNHKPINL